ncbi:SRA stem-loop-interacting RNA-binding protein, mitochondrial, partial [Harpegnathos saltator]
TKYMLQINNIPWTVGRQQLALYFSQFGYVYNAAVIFNKHTGFHEGYGFITVKKENLNNILQQKHILEGNELSV